MYLTNKITPPYPTSFCFSHLNFLSFFVPPPLGGGVEDFTLSHYLICYFGHMLFYYYPPIFVRSFIKIGPVPNFVFADLNKTLMLIGADKSPKIIGGQRFY